MVDKMDLLKRKINQTYNPDPFRIDAIYEEDLELYTVFVSQRLSGGKYFGYITQWDNELNCLHEIELSPDVLDLMKKNKDLIDKIKRYK